MLASLGQRLAAFFRATAPDPFVLAILLSLITYLLTWLGTPATASQVLDFWQAGFWDLLAFGMQMCLILVTGHALASSPPIAALLRKLASIPRTNRQAVILTSLVAMTCALINWGFGLIVGAILARDVTRAIRHRGIPAAASLIGASGYTCMLIWHGGLSGSAPLKAASEKDQIEVLGADLAAQIGAIETGTTIFSGLNLVASLGLLVIVPLVLALLVPRDDQIRDSHVRPPSDPAAEPAEDVAGMGRFPRFVETNPVIVWIIALPALGWLILQFLENGFSALTLNTANLMFLALGLLLHGSARRYGSAIETAARGCAGIILQFPIYAGIMGMMKASASPEAASLAEQVSSWFAKQAGDSEGALSALTFCSAGLVNLFVPSGGGQWAVQGPIAMQAALETGASPSKLVMAVAYGDQLTNMLQPFWALPLLAITGCRARDIVGYTAVVMIIAALWLVGCLVVM